MEVAVELVLLTIGAAAAALSIWLTVRLINRRKWSAVRLWVTLAAVPVGYSLSFGPWLYIATEAGRRSEMGADAFCFGFYVPLVIVVDGLPNWAQSLVGRYLELWMNGRNWFLDCVAIAAPPVTVISLLAQIVKLTTSQAEWKKPVVAVWWFGIAISIATGMLLITYLLSLVK